MRGTIEKLYFFQVHYPNYFHVIMQICNKLKTHIHTCNKPNNPPIQLIKQGISANRRWPAVHESLPPNYANM